MVELTITKDFLDRYRQYKIDVIENIAEPDFCYTALQELLNTKKTTLSTLYHELEGCEYIKMNVITGELIESKESLKSHKVKSFAQKQYKSINYDIFK